MADMFQCRRDWVGLPPGSHVLLAVNGSLMRGLDLNPTLMAVDAAFVRDATTEPSFRLWSINDRYPAMVRVRNGGAEIAVEVWSVPAEGVTVILLNEPEGLSIGKVTLVDGSVVLGVLGELAVCEDQREITGFGGWRAYIATLTR
jgi:gamma-glutamylcyclotransferase (GGCT)/AIG2-like uncharacterized protein YtfP